MVAYKERAAGIYRSTFVKLDPNYKLIDKDTEEEVTRWRWVFQEVSDPTTVGEMDTITSPSFRARTNGLKLFTGMLGRPPTDQDDTDQHLGKVFDVVWGPNQNGRMTIVNVLRVVDGENAAAVPAAATEAGVLAELP
jgi:hypothetical protein